jgi:hypothetical protein
MVIHLLAKIAYYIPDQPEFISTVFGWIAEAWKQAAEEVTFYNLAIASMCVFSVGSEQLEGQRDELMTGIVALLRREDVNDRNLKVACAALWATFITVYQVHGDPEWVKEILAALQLRRNMEVLPWVADFLVFAHGNWPDVVAPKWPSFVSTILSSDWTIVSRISAPSIRFVLTLLPEIPQDVLKEECGFSEAAFARLEKNVAQLTADAG